MLKGILRRDPNSHGVMLSITNSQALISLKNILLTFRPGSASRLICIQDTVQLKPATLPRPRRNKRLRLPGSSIARITVVVVALRVLAVRRAQPARVAEERFDAG